MMQEDYFMIKSEKNLNAILTNYDKLTTQKIFKGVNKRHKSIDRLLLKNGAKSCIDVLEIGAGIGTFTSLVAKE